MPAGKVIDGLSLRDILNLPMTGSLHRISDLTGISYGALKKLADEGVITSIPTEGKKILISTWSVIEKFNLAPIDVLKEVWLQKNQSPPCESQG